MKYLQYRTKRVYRISMMYHISPHEAHIRFQQYTDENACWMYINSMPFHVVGRYEEWCDLWEFFRQKGFIKPFHGSVELSRPEERTKLREWQQCYIKKTSNKELYALVTLLTPEEWTLRYNQEEPWYLLWYAYATILNTQMGTAERHERLIKTFFDNHGAQPHHREMMERIMYRYGYLYQRFVEAPLTEARELWVNGKIALIDLKLDQYQRSPESILALLYNADVSDTHEEITVYMD